MLTDGSSERTPDRSGGSANIWNDTHKRRSAFIFRRLDVFGTIFRTSQIRKRSHFLWLLCRCLVLISQFSSIFHTLTSLSELWNVGTMHQILFGFIDIFGIRQPFDDFNRCWPPTHRYHRRLVTNVKSTTGGKASALIGTTRHCVYMNFQCVSCIFRYFSQRWDFGVQCRGLRTHRTLLCTLSLRSASFQVHLSRKNAFHAPENNAVWLTEEAIFVINHPVTVIPEEWTNTRTFYRYYYFFAYVPFFRFLSGCLVQ